MEPILKMTQQETVARDGLDPKRLQEILPDAPGVYLFKDSGGRVIYVGKAKRLRKRVLSYFKPLDELPRKTAHLMERARGLDTLLTATENEAFILEASLIRKHAPRYNIILRDDKRYPSVRLDPRERFARPFIVRKTRKDGAWYFGPFSSANAVRETLRVIDRVFLLRKCRNREVPKRSRPCLNYQMGRCLGPCCLPVDAWEYRRIVERVRLFLEGRSTELVAQLQQEMRQAADALDFEKAARLRDQITAIERTVERQHVVSTRFEDQDVVGLAVRGHLFQMVVLFIRNGVLVGSRPYLIREKEGDRAEVLEAFLKQFYAQESFIPKRILVPEAVGDQEAIENWLSQEASTRVRILRPQRGENLRLVEMAAANAQSVLEARLKQEHEDLVLMVKDALALEGAPHIIEGLDISNFHGHAPVGTIVSFVDGIPHRPGYRSYRIRNVDGIDDYAMMGELVARRMEKTPWPDLFLVDGGKGHLAAVRAVIDRSRGAHPELRPPDSVSIAKPDEARHERYDKLYVPGRKNPIELPGDHPVLLLMMHIRDEAHRRAIGHHQKLLARRMHASILDAVPGVGKARKASLLKRFRDVEALMEASVEELAAVQGISGPLACEIKSFLERLRLESGPSRRDDGPGPEAPGD